jgi:hypothetical protein
VNSGCTTLINSDQKVEDKKERVKTKIIGWENIKTPPFSKFHFVPTCRNNVDLFYWIDKRVCT